MRARKAVRRLVVAARHRGIASDDVLLASYPKSGNTWLKFMLADYLSGGEVDFDSAETLVPVVGRHQRAPSLVGGRGRLCKSHEPWNGSTARFGKAIYVVRDGRDVASSYFAHRRRLGIDDGSFAVFVEKFLEGSIDGYTTWGRHVRSWLDAGVRERPERFLLVRYEEMRLDPEGALSAALDFVGAPLDGDRVAEVVVRNGATAMRAKESLSPRMREHEESGIPFVRAGFGDRGDDEWTVDLLRRFDEAAGDVLHELGYRPRAVALA